MNGIADKPLEELNDAEWEALCDGCGRCCLHRFFDERTGMILETDVACRLLDLEHCRCTDYARRLERVEGCIRVRDLSPAEYAWLPETCAYRLRAEGRPLPDWHPLVSGSAASVHEAGVSVAGFAVSELAVDEDEIERRIVAVLPPVAFEEEQA